MPVGDKHRIKILAKQEDSMTRNQIRGLLPKGVEGFDAKEAEDALYTLFNDALQSERDKLQAKITAADEGRKEAEGALQAALADETTDKELGELKAKLEAAETALKAEQEAHTATKTGYDTEKANANIDKQVLAAVKAAKLHDSVLPLFERVGYDRTLAKLDKDGKVTNLDKIVETIKADPALAPHFGGESRVEGAGAGDPPPIDTNALTKESIKTMTAEQINENWEAVSKVLESKT